MENLISGSRQTLSGVRLSPRPHHRTRHPACRETWTANWTRTPRGRRVRKCVNLSSGSDPSRTHHARKVNSTGSVRINRNSPHTRDTHAPQQQYDPPATKLTLTRVAGRQATLSQVRPSLLIRGTQANPTRAVHIPKTDRIWTPGLTYELRNNHHTSSMKYRKPPRLNQNQWTIKRRSGKTRLHQLLIPTKTPPEAIWSPRRTTSLGTRRDNTLGFPYTTPRPSTMPTPRGRTKTHNLRTP